MEEKKSCFIIMPITTPESFIENYRDGVEHFEHVLKCLLKPSVKMAGYKPIPPIAKGSDLIQAQIIQNLETSDLVLCDMSCLNPNVFFEFGIRTSLNKPVCVVKDELTNKVPFDTSILNYHEYTSTLDPWKLDKEITKLSDHLIASQERSKGENTLWRYFGFKSEAKPYEGETGIDAKFDFLVYHVDSLHKKIDKIDNMMIPGAEDKGDFSVLCDKVYGLIISELPDDVYIPSFAAYNRKSMTAEYSGPLPALTRQLIIRSIYDNFGVNLLLKPQIPPPPKRKKDNGL